MKIKAKHKTKLLHQIVEDMHLATRVADAAASAALGHMQAGRPVEAMHSILEVEPKLYDAQKLMSLSTYVKGLGNNDHYGDRVVAEEVED